MADTLLILALPIFRSLWFVPLSVPSFSSKLLIALMGFPRLCVAFYPKMAHECTQSKLNEVRHTWYVVTQCWPLDSRGLRGWLLFPSHWEIAGRVISGEYNQSTIGKLKIIKNFRQIYGYPLWGMLSLDLLCLISIQKMKRIGYQSK